MIMFFEIILAVKPKTIFDLPWRYAFGAFLNLCNFYELSL